jgi:hypothetical protein
VARKIFVDELGITNRASLNTRYTIVSLTPHAAKDERRGYTDQEIKSLDEIADEITDLGRQIDKSGLDGVESIADKETPEETVSICEELSEFIEKYPKECARITEYLNDVPNKEFAKAKGVSDSAASQELTKSRKTVLEHFKK